MPTTTCAFAKPLSDRDFQRCSAPKDRIGGKVDVLLGRGPVGDRDPHRTAVLPDRATHPTRPVALDRRDDRCGALVGGGRSEADEDLVEDDVVEDRDPGRGGEPLRDPAGERTASVYELGDAGSTERA